MTNDIHAVTECIEEATRTLILSRFSRLSAGDVEIKQTPDDIVTIVDREVEASRSTALSALEPTALVIGEEVAHAMQGFAFGYVQSDEASFLLRDDEALDTEAWFGKNLAKIVSISAATMSVHFSAHLRRTAVFDARAFVMPHADVPNYFVWRAKD